MSSSTTGSDTGLIGSSTLEILDGLYNHADKIRYIGCRHESNGMIMMDAYARYTAKNGVFLSGQAGPGVSNNVTAMAQAKAAFSPVVNLAGAIASDHKGKDAFQEIDQVSLMQAVSKKVFEVKDVESISSTLNDALRTAISPRSGPVHVDMPRDILGQSCESNSVSKFIPIAHPNAKETSLRKA